MDTYRRPERVTKVAKLAKVNIYPSTGNYFLADLQRILLTKQKKQIPPHITYKKVQKTALKTLNYFSNI